jgi:hypothetical protein
MFIHISRAPHSIGLPPNLRQVYTLYTSDPQPFSLPTAHPALTMAREGTAQHFELLNGGTRQYVATKLWILHINPRVIY